MQQVNDSSNNKINTQIKSNKIYNLNKKLLKCNRDEAKNCELLMGATE